MEDQPFFTEPISYREAGDYLKNIKDVKLKDIYRGYLGGTFNLEKFMNSANQENFSGIMFWFCLNNYTGEVFLVWEPKIKFSYPKNDPVAVAKLEPENDYLVKSKSLFGHDLAGETNFEKFVRTHFVIPNFQDDTLPKSEIKEYISNFLNHDTFKDHVKYGHAYFEDGDLFYVKNFLEINDIRFVRYYFGYDVRLSPNFIRVILAPVNESGSNIQYRVVGGNGELLQRSFPPPPNQ